MVRGALPTAERFEVETIPPARRSPTDVETNIYYRRAFDGQDLLVGYLRDYNGPVSPHAACACSPLQLTLAFDAQRRLLAILSPAPLQKYGHEALTAREHALLLQLAQKPPAALSALAEVEDVIDVSTGATQHALADQVVPQAALTTRRVVGLVQETQRLLVDAPADPGQERLLALLARPLAPRARARALAELQDDGGDAELHLRAYRAMVHFYLQLLAVDPRGDRLIERRLLRPNLSPAVTGAALADACTRLAERNLRPAVVDRCLRILTAADAPLVTAAQRALLLGLDHINKNRMQEALEPLREASHGQRVEANPSFFVRLARAMDASGERPAACATARRLYLSHPLLPEARALLATCVAQPAQPAQLEAERAALAAQMRVSLLAQDRGRGGGHAPSLRLQDSRGANLEVALSQPDQVTVVVFFATWCPHCRLELPRLKAFVAAQATATWAARVRLLVVRTARARETEDYAHFLAELRPNFPIWSDGPEAPGLNAFVREAGLAATLPTTAVVDPNGIIRFILPAGDFRDITQDLAWAIASLLPEGR